MGVAGAGVATVISQGVSVALCILYVFRSARLLLPEKKHFHVESRLYWELFSQSISMGLMSSIVSAGSVVLQYGINGSVRWSSRATPRPESSLRSRICP